MHRPMSRRAPKGTAEPHTITELHINGGRYQISHAQEVTVLDLIRERLDLRGAKPACRRGECGACTVLVDGVAKLACMTLVARVTGHIETIEGLEAETQRLREAFADAGAFQCGYCTPGHVVRAAAMLRDNSLPADDAELRHQLAGNICRCTGYEAIIRAIRSAETSTADCNSEEPE